MGTATTDIDEATEKYGEHLLIQTTHTLLLGLLVVIEAGLFALRGPTYALNTAEVNTHSCTLDALVT